MKTFTFAVIAALVALASDVQAEQESSVHLRIHHGKFYVTPIGKQCAYDVKRDASVYPCMNGGTCVRLNSTYGVCKAAAPKAKEAVDLTDVDSSDYSDSSEDSDSSDYTDSSDDSDSSEDSYSSDDEDESQ